MDDGNEGPRASTGRLHGRLLGILAAVSVAAAVAAVWLFSPMMFQGDEETAADWPWEDSATVGVTIGELSSKVSPEASAEASTTSAVPSPEASSAEPSTEPPPASSEPPATTEAAEPEPEPEPEGPECTASLWVVNEWRQSGEYRFEAWVEVVNTGADAIDDWEVTLAFDDADVYETWGMEHEDGDRYESDRWNGDLEPGQSADAAFQAAADDEVDVPDTVPCSAFD